MLIEERLHDKTYVEQSHVHDPRLSRVASTRQSLIIFIIIKTPDPLWRT